MPRHTIPTLLESTLNELQKYDKAQTTHKLESRRVCSSGLNVTTTSFQQQVFIDSMPIAGIRAKIEQNIKIAFEEIFMHLGFKYHNDQCA